MATRPKRARRGGGEGGLGQRPDGYWAATLELGRDVDGRRLRVRISRKTKREALEAIAEARAAHRAGLVNPTKQTTGDYLDWWAENVLPLGGVKDSTVDDYRYVIGRYIAPHVGAVPLSKLSPAHVETMLHRLEKEGKSPRTRSYARAVLRRALRHAEQRGYVARNPAAIVDGPRQAGTRLDDVLDADDARKVLAAIEDDRLYALAFLALRLGFRKGELLALRWDNIDLDAATVTVAGTLRRQKGGGLVVDTPKTAAAARTVPLVAGTLEALAAHRRRQAEERLALGPAWVDSGHVFTTPLGTPIDPSNALSWWYRATIAAGIGRRRFHATRHTCATLMLADGVPLEVVSAVLGHAGLAITADTYARVSADAKRQALARLADVYEAR